MKKACIYDIGNCFVFDVEVNDYYTCEMLKKDILDNKVSAMLIGDSLSLPFSEGHITVFLFRAYSRKAYDLYFKIGGMHIRSLDPYCVQRILSSIGVTSCKEPCIYEFNNVDITRKE